MSQPTQEQLEAAKFVVTKLNIKHIERTECYTNLMCKNCQDATQAITALIQEAREYLVNRFEVIDHTSNGEGRAFVKWEDVDFKVKLDLQDDNRTLKVFLTDSGGSNND